MDAPPPLFRSAAAGVRYSGWLTLGVALTCGVPAFVCIESAARGPYTAWYNQDLKARALQAHLVGRSVADVEPVLGPADDIWDRQGSTTFNYAPYPFGSFAKFQVHAVDGVVTSVEMFDD